MNTYLFSSLCLLAINSAHAADAAPSLMLPAAQITAPEVEAEAIDLKTATRAGSRLNLNGLQTPASVESLSGERMRARGDRSVQSAVTRTTGISYTGSPGNGGAAYSARGFVGEGSVMQLYDGTRLYSGAGTVTFPVDDWSVERIDVLRGPASVLYGEGATGAVINVIPKKPFSGDIENHLRLGYGSYDTRQQALDSGGSLTDTLSYRLNINHTQSNGWIDRGDSENTFISAALRWQASDDLAFTLSHDYGDQAPQNDFGAPLIKGRYHKSLRDKNYNVRDAKLHYNDQWTRLNTEWQINDTLSASNELYYLKAQRRWQNAENHAWDEGQQSLLRGGYFSIKHNQEQTGDRQTFTLNHNLFGLNSRTLVGADYNRIHFNLHSNSPYDDVVGSGEPIDLNAPARDYWHSVSPYRNQFTTTTQQVSLFAENRTELTEQLSLVTGVRRDIVHLDRNDFALDGTTARSDRSFSANSWKAGLVYELTPDMSVYAQQATSVDAVGGLISLSAGQQSYGLAHARQTEVGFKQMFWDQRGEWTLAAYHIIKKDLLTPDPNIPGKSLQVGEQSSNGLEATLDLQLPNRWQVQANAAVVRAQYDTFDDRGISREGNRPAEAPRRTANLWVSKGISDTVNAGAGVRYVDARYADIANTVQLPSYTVVDATASWKVLPDTTLGLRLNNVFNRQYAASQYNDGQQWIMGEPRSFFVTADYTF
ncbi:TonB-dependent receptor [Pseudomonas sp.]|uniref:TonB-dependent receptor n=1 Tax=Pseudomonas sp. TaxID=306 RepID=UPI0026370B02|nr:TonB-dependent receptor [Pseudomonas sp.]